MNSACVSRGNLLLSRTVSETCPVRPRHTLRPYVVRTEDDVPVSQIVLSLVQIGSCTSDSRTRPGPYAPYTPYITTVTSTPEQEFSVFSSHHSFSEPLYSCRMSHGSHMRNSDSSSIFCSFLTRWQCLVSSDLSVLLNCVIPWDLTKDLTFLL